MEIGDESGGPGDTNSALPRTGGREDGRADGDVDVPPYRAHIIADEIRSDGGRPARAVTWSVSDGQVAPLLYQLETMSATTRYDVHRDADRWEIFAEFNRWNPQTAGEIDVAGAIPTELRLSSEAWSAALEPVFSDPASIVESAASEAPLAEARPTSVVEQSAAGGSGYVRIEDRGRMDWMWDEEILRLEPSR